MIATHLPFEKFFRDYRPLYRDTTLAPDLFDSYRPGMLIREPSFCDATYHFGGLAAPHRYLIFAGGFPCIDAASEHPEWGLCVGQLGTFFKVLGSLRRGESSQVALLEIPEDIVGEFKAESLGPIERSLAADAEASFESALQQRPRPEHTTTIWLERLANPLGIRDDGTFFDLDNPWGEAVLAQLVAAGVVKDRSAR